ncbi:hypothetical protein Ssi03_33270 [Sphaerisporangium siamense]|uniref:DUF2207 domain-containing protein n=1 Tax=Sphaerisporangium siamense TaxID=795645 RepID=A0A7W7G7J7_9ACTN|nr:DUF2207 domain-containing protein [Sphaerisporangium siamense]MBB4698604.1 hypothetical protein [Sphaerisporangium siamense]GII85337.1 hypothetical protein Ssi03_33270 [Sphaerisporangium siamense]
MVDLARRLTLALAALSVLAAAPAAHAAADSVNRTDVTVELRAGGMLHVKEQISFTGQVRRTLLTRTRYDDGNDRVYRITGFKGDGALSGDVITLKGNGSATVEYDVAGAVTPLSDGEELRWYAVNGWSAPVKEAVVRLTGPAPMTNLSCFAGDITSATGCTAASMTSESGLQAEYQQSGLGPSQALTVVAGFPKGASGGKPILERRFDLATAFTVSPVTGGALGGLLVLLLGGVVLLHRLQGRDARIIDHESGGRVTAVRDGRFAPPDGVRPGQIGTLIDEQADVVDVTATIVDLAVRGYVRIDEQPRGAYDAPDWMLVKVPDARLDELLDYERALYLAIFDGRKAVLLSQLHGSFASRLGRVRDALYRDVVAQGWFARRPDSVRTRWTTLGVTVAVLGVLATVLLAWFTTYGLLGLALIIAGAALAVGGQYMPAKTARGSTALAHTLGFRDYLAGGEIGEVPAAQRIELFSRYLPYAVVFDNVDRWARVVSSIDGDGRQADHLYWYQGPAEWDLTKFADSMRTFTLTTSGAISASRPFRRSL